MTLNGNGILTHMDGEFLWHPQVDVPYIERLGTFPFMSLLGGSSHLISVQYIAMVSCFPLGLAMAFNSLS